MKIRFLLFSLLLLVSTGGFGQAIPDTTTRQRAFFIEVGGVVASAPQTPFWLRSRQYGLVPLSNPAGIARLGGVRYVGDPANPRRVNVKLGVEGVLNLAPDASRVLLPEVYASFRLGGFELYGGRRREMFGLTDTLLSSGSYAWSGNALPITKVQLGTRGFVPVPFTGGRLAINALFAHGWFSNTDSVQGSFLHQKVLFARVSLLQGRAHLFAGVAHHAQWGGRRSALGNLTLNGQIPGTLRNYWDVITVRPPPNDTTQYSRFDLVNRVGNHLGSIDLALDFLGSQSNWYLYYQHPYEDKSGVAFQNMPDGLYGVRWRNVRPVRPREFRLMQLTMEVLSTTNQGGFDIKTGSRLYDGADDYFNNYQYVDGWTQQQRIIGTPFMTRWLDARSDLHDLKGAFGREMISNNRVQVVHVGLLGGWPSGVQLRALLSHSNNFGRPITHDPRTPLSQFSGLIESMIPLDRLGQSQIKIALAVDQGGWLTNSLGGWLSFRETLFN